VREFMRVRAISVDKVQADVRALIAR
jgi:hypothetical protein